jgi:hypothetical protein
MSETPRTDVEAESYHRTWEESFYSMLFHAKQLERELREAKKLLRDILENWRNGIEENEIIKFLESEAQSE